MKRIITCSDGTWNSPDKEFRTNVELFYQCIEPVCANGIYQSKFYDQGVGSSNYDREDQVVGGLTGLGIDQNIKEVYKFIMLNYEPGDEIYLFGFSRGAYTARSLAGFIHNCGILKPVNLHLVDEAYEYYRNRDAYRHPQSDAMKSFRRNFAIEDCTPIKFIGVWDTVGSLGFPWKKKYNAARYRFHDVKISSTVEYAYHALAIDERRKPFTPTLWELSDLVKSSPDHKQVMEQRWFVGVHSNIGGGYEDTGLSDIPLQWLIQKSEAAGLKINHNLLEVFAPKYNFNPSYKGKKYNSLSWYYYLLLWFNRRKIMGEWYNEKGERMITNETIDPSVFQRYNDRSLWYKPRNLRQVIKGRRTN